MSFAWNERRVVVTGAGGFIGSHLAERLLARGARVTAMVHGDPQYRAGFLAPRRAELELAGGDLRDASFVRKAVAGADTVFHLGAITSVAYSYANPEETIATNTLGTQNVCAACLESGVRRLVHTSTAGAYGNALEDKPIAETHPVMACNPYTAGKLGGDLVAQTYHLSYGLPVATIRLFNTYGPRMGRYLIMPSVILQLIESPELKLGDLTPTRPFTYVDDIVDAFLAMAESDAALGELVHFGTESDISMAGLVAKIAQVMDTPYRVVQDPSRMRPQKSEIFRVRVDAGKARRLLGWEPTVDLDTGLRRTVDWIRAGGYANRRAGEE